MTRFHLVDAPALMPGKCVICGSVGGDGRKFFDIGITIEFVGTPYFCTLCMGEAQSVLGFVDPTVHVNMVHELAEAKQTIERLEVECNDLRSLVDSLNLFGLIGGSEPEAESAGADRDATDSATKRPESEAPKSNPGGRRKDFSDLGIPEVPAKST